MPKLRLYYFKGSVSSFVRILLYQGEFEDVAFTELLKSKTGLVTADGVKYSDINPKALIPTLEIDDSIRLTETVAIAQYLMSLKPEKYYWPEKESIENFKALALFNYVTAEIHKTIIVCSRPFSNDDVKNWAAKELTRRYKYLERILESQPFLLGDEFSPVDCYAYTTTRWPPKACNLNFDENKFPNIINWRRRIEQLEFVKKAIHDEGLKPLESQPAAKL